ncbi:epi-inositol hydrolase [Vibrio sp. JCM 19052]|nr:epi-inositol hydrolase [Vibrio sp. JCM 19052]
MKTVRLTVAEALAQYLAAQMIEIDGKKEQLFGAAFAIFGHGNVTCFGQQLKNIEDKIPTWRGQNEQSMATAAIAYAKANLRLASASRPVQLVRVQPIWLPQQVSRTQTVYQCF